MTLTAVRCLAAESRPNMRMHLPKPRAPFSDAVRYPRASSQVIRGR